MIEFLLIFPVAAAVIIFLVNSRPFSCAVILTYAFIFLAISVNFCWEPASFTAYFSTDKLNVFFLLILAVVFAGVALYNAGYLGMPRAPVGARPCTP